MGGCHFVGGVGVSLLFVGLFLSASGVSGCAFTSVGIDQPDYRAQLDFGPPETVKVCAVLDNGITQENAQKTLAGYWNETDAEKYSLSVNIVSYSHKERPLSEYFSWQIADDVSRMPVPAFCDRVMYFVGRNLADALWSIPEIAGAPEVLGWVDDATMARGFVVSRFGSLNQVLMGLWFSPSQAARHETYHLLGCGHDLTLQACYDKIRDAKALEAALERAGCYEKADMQPFLPAFPNAGNIALLTRAQVNSVPSDAGIRGLDDFVRCARGADLPVDDRAESDVAHLSAWLSSQLMQPLPPRMVTR